MATTTWITVDQFERIGNPPGGRYELHHGELVAMTLPKLAQVRIQAQLAAMLKAIAPGYFVTTEFPYRPLPDYELWGADVASVSLARLAEAGDEYLEGSPDIVIEVLSPSNTAAEIEEKERLCLESGCREFWVVNPARRTVRISTAEGTVARFGPGQKIAARLFGAEISLDDIFPS